MSVQSPPHILPIPWQIGSLRTWRSLQILVLALALSVSSSMVSAASHSSSPSAQLVGGAIPIPHGDSGIRLINRSSGKCLDVEWASRDDHALVQHYTCHLNSNQLWYLSRPYVGYYTTIRSMNSGKCLDVVGGSRFDGAYVQQYPCHGESNQQWLFRPDGQGYYYLVNQNSGLCLDIASPNGINVVQKTCRGGWNQLWRAEPAYRF